MARLSQSLMHLSYWTQKHTTKDISEAQRIRCPSVLCESRKTLTLRLSNHPRCSHIAATPSPPSSPDQRSRWVIHSVTSMVTFVCVCVCVCVLCVYVWVWLGVGVGVTEFDVTLMMSTPLTHRISRRLTHQKPGIPGLANTGPRQEHSTQLKLDTERITTSATP